MTNSFLPKELENFIEMEARNFEYTIVAISTSGTRGFSIEIILDKSGGITLDECGRFNRAVSNWIETNDIIESNFTVDVCSPGLDRKLKSGREFSWAKGRDVKIITVEPIDEKTEFIGKMRDFKADEQIVSIETESGNIVDIDQNNIVKARVWTDFGKKKAKKNTKKMER